MVSFLATQPTSFPELIKKVRKLKHLTQKDFGRLLNPPVAQPTVARWEKGEQLPDRKYFPKIASLLDFTLEDLFKFVDEPLVDIVDTSITSEPIDLKAYIPNKQHLAILNRGVVAWNRWRERNPEVNPELAGAKPIEQDLSQMDFSGADLRGVDFRWTSLCNAKFIGADLREANLTSANLSNADLRGADLTKATLINAYFVAANLNGANLSAANLKDANFSSANLNAANFSFANLTFVDLRCAVLVEANFTNAILSNCLVYGVSAWGVKLDGATQTNLNICPHNVSCVYIDNLKSAYIKSLALENPKDSQVQDAANQLQNVLEQNSYISREHSRIGEERPPC